VVALPTPKRVAAAVRHRRTRTVEDSRMSLTEHLTELRNRLAKAIIAIAITSIVCFIFEPHIFNFLKEPYCHLPASKRVTVGVNQECRLYFFGIVDGFMIRLKISAIAGIIAASPVWLYQLWSFITPGLHRHERRWSLTFVAASLILFVLGAFFAYLTLSKGLSLLLGFGGNGLASLLDVNKYLSYVTAMLLIFGLSFELPLLVTMLNLAGVVPTQKLRDWRRPEIFLVFVFAAVVTPSQDPFTMLALGLPMVLLYEVAVIIGRINDRRKARKGDQSPYAHLGDDETSPLDLDLDLPEPTPAPAGPAAEAPFVPPTASAGASSPTATSNGSSGGGSHLDIT
jgi:sec-independent protein translocase protein TatC